MLGKYSQTNFKKLNGNKSTFYNKELGGWLQPSPRKGQADNRGGNGVIPKLWCFVFGHKYFEINFSGEYGKEEVANPITGIKNKQPIMIRSRAEFCPRCGAKLNGKKT